MLRITAAPATTLPSGQTSPSRAVAAFAAAGDGVTNTSDTARAASATNGAAAGGANPTPGVTTSTRVENTDAKTGRFADATTSGGGGTALVVTDAAPQTTAGATTTVSTLTASVGFATQSLAQETIGAGLHIEPWTAALTAYRRAGAPDQGQTGLLNQIVI